ncbi:fumarylacetoacetate hydrolase family protein [Actinomadura graeca]|uniref:fumarylacetoacetase n=1 Tax=Actinomadura graeca TaxID=2750812 RepID=A0ABX8QQQ3_9ACTN|nr:fumarylacetoacetate hydrolase family protein [Actinomadura graeca]QXJ21126.1 fumarylacetoacetate hydrolase family protein [Actinomadura graeca]
MVTVGDFGDATLPYGVFRAEGGSPRVGVAVGGLVLDVATVVGAPEEFVRPDLNRFLARGPHRWKEVRKALQERAASGVSPGQEGVHRIADVQMMLPVEVADFVDFFSGIEHATNAGRILRPGEEPLKPNYRYLPAGYHGRAGTVVVSGTDVVRPEGQIRHGEHVTVGPSARLDFELELGYVVGTPSTQGVPVPAEDFRDHVFGVVVLVDWSARDIQAWEYQPLGPFLAKSFATTISPWVVPLDALPWVDGPVQRPAVLDYLNTPEPRNPAVEIEVELNGVVISRVSAAGLYWSPAQQMAHMTRGGASLRTGDLYGTGTISSHDPSSAGSLLEISWGGERPFRLSGDETRTFLEDGDVVIVRASVPGEPDRSLVGGRRPIGDRYIGEARTVIRPAPSARWHPHPS